MYTQSKISASDFCELLFYAFLNKKKLVTSPKLQFVMALFLKKKKNFLKLSDNFEKITCQYQSYRHLENSYPVPAQT